jgi:hypothetical protein
MYTFGSLSSLFAKPSNSYLLRTLLEHARAGIPIFGYTLQFGKQIILVAKTWKKK